MLSEENGVKLVTFRLTAGSDVHRLAKLPLSDVIDLLAEAKTEADFRREFWLRAHIPRSKRGQAA